MNESRAARKNIAAARLRSVHRRIVEHLLRDTAERRIVRVYKREMPRARKSRIVLESRAPVSGIVVAQQKLLDERVPLPDARETLLALNRLPPVQRHETVELLREAFGLREIMRVLNL